MISISFFSQKEESRNEFWIFPPQGLLVVSTWDFSTVTSLFLSYSPSQKIAFFGFYSTAKRHFGSQKDITFAFEVHQWPKDGRKKIFLKKCSYKVSFSPFKLFKLAWIMQSYWKLTHWLAKWTAEWEVQTLWSNVFQRHNREKSKWVVISVHWEPWTKHSPLTHCTKSQETKHFLPFYELLAPVMHKSCVSYSFQPPAGNRLSQRGRWALDCLEREGISSVL